MTDQWKSTALYEHPAKHQAGTLGNVVLSPAGIYSLRVGGSTMSCPQDWAAKIHHDEGEPTVIMLRGVPEFTRRALKARAAQEGKSMQGLVLEIIQQYLTV